MRFLFLSFHSFLKKITLVNPLWEDSFAAVLFPGCSKRNCICSSQRMKLDLLCPDDPLLLHPAHFWERLLLAVRDSALTVLAPAFVHEGTGTDLGPRSPKLELGTVWSASVWVCFRSKGLFMEGKSSNVLLCFLIGVETTFCSVIDLYLLRYTLVSESIRQLKDAHFHLASCRFHNTVGCWSVKSVESNWEVQISLWHLGDWTVIYFFSWLVLRTTHTPFSCSVIKSCS